MSSSYLKCCRRVCPPNSFIFYSIDLIFTYVLENCFCYKIHLCKMIIGGRLCSKIFIFLKLFILSHFFLQIQTFDHNEILTQKFYIHYLNKIKKSSVYNQKQANGSTQRGNVILGMKTTFNFVFEGGIGKPIAYTLFF